MHVHTLYAYACIWKRIYTPMFILVGIYLFVDDAFAAVNRLRALEGAFRGARHHGTQGVMPASCNGNGDDDHRLCHHHLELTYASQLLDGTVPLLSLANLGIGPASLEGQVIVVVIVIVTVLVTVAIIP